MCVFVNVTTLNDIIVEENETFIGELRTIDTTPDHVSIVEPSTASGIIIDGDLVCKYNTCSS